MLERGGGYLIVQLGVCGGGSGRKIEAAFFHIVCIEIGLQTDSPSTPICSQAWTVLPQALPVPPEHRLDQPDEVVAKETDCPRLFKKLKRTNKQTSKQTASLGLLANEHSA